MQKYIIIDLPAVVQDYEWPYIIHITKIVWQHQRYTGYKELEEAGVDIDYFLERSGLRLLKNGAIRLTNAFIDKYKRHIYFGEGDKERYYLDPDIFEYEFNLTRAFKEKDPVWFIPEAEFNTYNQDMFNELPDQLKTWFLKKIKMGLDQPAQHLLDNTYSKYVVRKEPLPDWWKAE